MAVSGNKAAHGVPCGNATAVLASRGCGAVPETPCATRQDVGLSRRQRILSPLLFREAFDNGKSYTGKALVMWIRQGDDAEQRLGVVAAKRTFRHAVDRNRAKRLLREAFRLNRWRMKTNADVVLLARFKILKMKRQDVEKDLLNVFKNAHMVD